MSQSRRRPWIAAGWAALAASAAWMAPAPAAKAQEPPKAEAEAEAPAPAPETKAPTLDDDARRKNVESFDVVWETIREKHFDPKLNGADWDAIRAELRPKVESAETMREARAAMSEMIGRLKQSHFGIIPAQAYREVEATAGDRSGEGRSGIEVRVVDGQALVVEVEPGSPAEAKGVKPGWRLVKVDGEEVAPAIEKVAKAYEASTQREFRTARAVASRLDGPVGETIAVEFADADDEPVVLEIDLARPTGVPARFGNLPTFYVKFDSRPIGDDGSIRYVRLSAFFDPVRVIAEFGRVLTEHREAKGLVIDLRGNHGGIGAMAMGFGGWLVDGSDLKLGTMSTRDTELFFSLNPRPGAFLGPVAVLIDGASLSTSEILAGGLKDIGRARLFGTRTGGAALPSVIVRLPNGDGFQYAFANYISAGGRPLEGEGVAPHVEAPPTREALLDGRDPALDAAVAWIREQAEQS